MGVIEVLASLALLSLLLLTIRSLLSDVFASRSTARPVLPSTYDPVVYTVRREYRPGYCLHCGAENDPERTYCRECVAKLSTPSERGDR